METKHIDNNGYITYSYENDHITTYQQEHFKVGDKVYNRHRKIIGIVISVESGCNGLIYCDFGYGFVMGYNHNDLGVVINDKEYIYNDYVYQITY